MQKVMNSFQPNFPQRMSQKQAFSKQNSTLAGKVMHASNESVSLWLHPRHVHLLLAIQFRVFTVQMHQ